MVIVLEKELLKKKKFPVEIEKGICIGEYIKPKPKDLFKYGRVNTLLKIGKTGIMPLLDKRTHGTIFDPEYIRTKLWEENVNVLKSSEGISEQYAYCGFTTYRSPVYKPYKYYTAGPFTQCDNPIIEKIIHKGRKMYLGIINNKLVTYSVSYDKDGKKQFHLRDLKMIGEEQNNRQYLRKVAAEKLNEFIEKDKRIKEKITNPTINNVYLYGVKLSYLNNEFQVA